jgi:hypothetical protein
MALRFTQHQQQPGRHWGEPVAFDLLQLTKFTTTQTMTYKILRFHVTKATRVICRGLTLEEAQAHCHNPKTRREGVWFDGYEAE